MAVPTATYFYTNRPKLATKNCCTLGVIFSMPGLSTSALFLLKLVVTVQLYFPGKKINRVACGSAHSLAWSTNKPVNAGRLPLDVPMEYNHLQPIEIHVLRNRLVLLHHFSDLLCPSIPMFDLEQIISDLDNSQMCMGPDSLRGVLVSSAKVGTKL